MTQPWTPNAAGPRQGKGSAVKYSVLGGIGALIVLGAIINASSGSSNSGSNSGTKHTVKAACQTAIKSELRAPATAHFHDEVVAQTTDGQWSDTGQVDSENGFGALLTSTFVCTSDEFGDVQGTPLLIPH